jgi:recombination protein RecA
MSIGELRDRLQKASKGTHVSILSESTIATERNWFPTPSYDLNRILSGSLYRGIPSKCLALLVGPEASFKSSMMCLCAVEAQKQGYTVVVIDTEGAWTGDFVSRWGLDAEKMIYIYTPWIDEIFVLLGDIITAKDKKLCLVLDSLGGLEKLKLVKDSNDGKAKADQGMLQKEMKRMLKMILNICKGQDSSALMSGHYYGNPTGYGDAEQIGGGKFAKLAPDMIVSLKKTQLYENPTAAAKDRIVIGNQIRAITMKNRFAPPFQEATVQINYHDGINKYAGLVDMALTCDIIVKGGAWFTLPGGKKVQGEKAVLEAFAENPDEILRQLEEIISKTGYSTTNEELKLAQEIVSE